MPIPTLEQLKAIDGRARVSPDVVRGALSRVPPSWTMLEVMESGAGFRRGNIQVLFSVLRYDDGRVWIHVSAAGRRSANSWFLPSWDDLKRVKDDFIGSAHAAYQVLPPDAEYVNQHAYVLHLFALLDGTPALPDFAWGIGAL